MRKLKQEYIGSDMEIISSRNKTLIGLNGRIIDETKNTFKIKIGEKIKIVLKNGNKFKIKNQEINGKEIIKKPEDRIKK